MSEESSISKMNVIILVAVLSGAAYCRPQYNYNPPSVPIPIPSGSYGRPGSGGIFVNGGSGGYVSGGGIGSGGFNGISGGGAVNNGGFISGGGGSFGGGFAGGSGGGSGISGGGSSSSFISGGGSSSSFISGGGSGGGFVSGGGIGGGISSGGGSFVGGSGGTLVQKHVYVHVAPPEPEEVRPQHPINIGQSTKHYKIIFIKAPSYPTPTAQQIALQAQNQEKTLIYVLVKKPDEVADITIPSIAPIPPSKPEVYFIRYKTQNQVAQGGGGNIGGGFISGGSGNIGGGFVNGGSGVISSGGSSSSSSGGFISSGGGGSGIDIGSSISSGSGGGSISGGSITSGIGGGGVSSVGGGLSTNYGAPGQSGPY